MKEFFIQKRDIFKGFIICIAFFQALGCVSAERAKVCFKNICILTEVADSDFERERGLMSRDGLSAKGGMLFIFPGEDFYTFWMKNMNFPLDIIWISGDKRVVNIIKSAKPCDRECPKLLPDKKARYVLEVESGFADKYTIALGDSVNFR